MLSQLNCCQLAEKLAGSGLYSVPVASGWGWILKNIRYVIHYGTPVIAETSLYRKQAGLFQRRVYMATPYRWHTRICLLFSGRKPDHNEDIRQKAAMSRKCPSRKIWPQQTWGPVKVLWFLWGIPGVEIISCSQSTDYLGQSETTLPSAATFFPFTYFHDGDITGMP